MDEGSLQGLKYCPTPMRISRTKDLDIIHPMLSITLIQVMATYADTDFGIKFQMLVYSTW